MPTNNISGKYLRVRLSLALTLIAASVTSYLLVDFIQSKKIKAQREFAELLQDTAYNSIANYAKLDDVLGAPSERLAETLKSQMRPLIEGLATNTTVLKKQIKDGASSPAIFELLENPNLDPIAALDDFILILRHVSDTPTLWGGTATRHVELVGSLLDQILPVLRRFDDIERGMLEAATRRITVARMAMTTLIACVLAGIWIFIFSPMQKSILQAQSEIMRQKSKAEDASKSKSEFLAMISHEIRTPMNGVLGMAELLKDTQLDPTQNDILDTITYSGKSLLAVINDVLDFSKFEFGRIELETAPIDLHNLLTKLHQLLHPQLEHKGIRFSIELPDNLAPQLLGDSARIFQILSNLAANAVKFTEKGEVTIRLTAEPITGGKQHLLFEVQDTGIGMSPEQQSRIFNKFEQADSSTNRRFGGTGLGLSIAKLLTEAMGGTLSVISAEGEGSAFRFEVELLALEEAKIKNPDSIVQQPGTPLQAGIRSLVVDDNKVNRKVISLILEKLSCRVMHAENGEQAVDLFRNTRPHIVFMDISMPGMNGYDATRIIREDEERYSRPRTRIIALSAHVGDEFDEKCRQSGMDAILRKPLEKTALLTELRKVPPITLATPTDDDNRYQMNE